MSSDRVSTKQYRPSWVIDLILTTIFGFLVSFIVICFYTTNIYDLYIFFASCAGIFVAIKATDLFCIFFMRDIVSKKLLGAAPFNHPLGNNKTFVKFVGSAWQLVIHLSMTLVELYILQDETWLEKPWTTYSQPWTVDYDAKPSLRLFFILQMAIWVCTCFSHRFNADAHMHKDYIPMYVHHIVTIILVTIAYITRHTRAGFVTLFIHDFSDIGIDLLKICNYLRLEGKHGFYLVEVSYATAIGLWAYFRLYEFPSFIYNGALRICSYSSTWLASDGTHTYGYYLGETFGYSSNIFYFSVIGVGVGVVLLTVLLGLHIWWFALLLRILSRLLASAKPHEAGAAEYEGSDQEDEASTQPDPSLVSNSSNSSTVPDTVTAIRHRSAAPVLKSTKI